MSVLTPSIPERAAMLKECKASVQAQTVDPGTVEHVVGIDRDKRGCAWSMNRLANKASGEWLVPFADDDLMLPHCITTLLEHSDQADIVYGPPQVWGRPAEPFCRRPPEIPSFALIRASLWHDLGGYDERLIREEDRNLWIAALNKGARFVRVDEELWVYRHHAGNKSFNRGIAA